MSIIHYCDQLSDEHRQLRVGIPTASCFEKIVTPKGKLSDQSADYRNWLLAEWVVGLPLEHRETEWMTRGHDLEPEARKAYEFETGRDTEIVGFITTDDGMIGVSPDGLIGSDGLLEIKSPAPQTHVGYMLTRAIEQKYKPQVQGQLLVSERAWLDIVSYAPGFPTVIVRVERDEPYIALLEGALREFVEGLLAARAELDARYGPFTRKQRPQVQSDDPGSLGITDADVEALVAARFPETSTIGVPAECVDTGIFPMLDTNIAGELTIDTR